MPHMARKKPEGMVLQEPSAYHTRTPVGTYFFLTSVPPGLEKK